MSSTSGITLSGNAASAIEAAWPHWGRVEKYATKSLWMLPEEERGYWVQECLDHFLHVSQKLWVEGEDRNVSLVLIIKYIKRKARSRGAFRRRFADLKYLERSNPKERDERRTTRLDVKIAVEGMDDLAREVLTLLSHGESWEEVCRLCLTSVWTISRIRGEFRVRLADYDEPGLEKGGSGKWRKKE